MTSCFLHSSHTNGIEEVISNVVSLISISVLPSSTTCPVVPATEMLVFLSARDFHVGLSSFLLEGKIDGTGPSTRALRPTPKVAFTSFAWK